MKKIVVLESYLQYVMVVGYAVMLGMSQFMIGMCLMACIIMSSCNHHYDVHHWYCFFGGQVLFGEGIMAFNYADGWASSLPMRYRRVIHPVLQVGGTCYYFYGALAGVGSGRNIAAPHALIGVASVLCVIMSACFGLATLLKKSAEDTTGSKVHVGFGIATYAIIGITSIIGFISEDFDKLNRLVYMPKGGSGILFVLLVVFCNATILVRPVKRLLFKYTYSEPK